MGWGQGGTGTAFAAVRAEALSMLNGSLGMRELPAAAAAAAAGCAAMAPAGAARQPPQSKRWHVGGLDRVGHLFGAIRIMPAAFSGSVKRERHRAVPAFAGAAQAPAGAIGCFETRSKPSEYVGAASLPAACQSPSLRRYKVVAGWVSSVLNGIAVGIAIGIAIGIATGRPIRTHGRSCKGKMRTAVSCRPPQRQLAPNANATQRHPTPTNTNPPRRLTRAGQGG